MTAKPPVVPGGGRPHASAILASARRGFTLLELMAVIVLLGLTLMFVPPNLEAFGDRAKLDSTTNSMVAIFGAAKEMAISDGHAVKVQLDLGNTSDRTATGRTRFLVSSIQREAPEELTPGVERRKPTTEQEDEWIETTWRSLPHGVVLSGYSDTSGKWTRSTDPTRPIEITFLPDGTVRPAFAIRVQSVDLSNDVPHVMTVLVNALTSAPSVVEGEAELPTEREPSDFRY